MKSRALIVCRNEPLRDEIALALDGIRCERGAVDSAPELLRRLAGPDRPDLIVLDPAVPGGSRPDLLRLLRDSAPESVVVVVIDPEAEEAPVAPGSAPGVFRYLIRPWGQDDIRTMFRTALSRATLLAENRRLARLDEEQKRVLWEDNERLARATVKDGSAVEDAALRTSTPDVSARMGDAILEAYSAPLALHSRAVATGSRNLARAVGLPRETVARIETAGRLHDLGYVGLPRYLLARPPDRLTDKERADMERHPILGEEIVGSDPGYADVARAIRHHHEQFDGSGFPDGLKGEGIPLGARIIHVADVYDRAYRRAVADGGAAARTRGRRALREARGGALDPALVDLFLDGAAVLMAGAREIQVVIDELQEGMILTRDLRAANDLFIASGGTRLDRTHIDRIKSFHRRSPILAEVFVRTA